MSLSAAEILAADDRKVVAVSVPEWGGAVLVRSLSTEEMLDMQEVLQPLEKVSDIWAVQLSKFVCDDAGTPLFADAAAARGLLKKSTAVVKRVVDAGMSLNRLESPAANKEKS